MQREIKCRAWDGSQMIYKSNLGEYDDYYWLSLEGDFFGHTRTGDNDFEYENDETNKKSFTLMQFTGMSDADINGNYVYEGDIIKNVDTGALQVVYYNEEKASFYCHYIQDENSILPLWESIGNLNKVIGNIYQHPHLLK